LHLQVPQVAAGRVREAVPDEGGEEMVWSKITASR
jgi:hypothetical protein